MPRSVDPQSPTRVPEAFVAWLWQERKLGLHLRTTDGRPLQVVYPGRRVGSWGPDFQGALLVLAGQVLRGDVEVHPRSRDWHVHGHGSDSAYGATVLHVVFDDEAAFPAARPDGALLATVALRPLLGEPVAVALARWRAVPPTPPEPRACLTPEEAGALLDRAGLERFRGKAARFEADLMVVDPEQALWAGLLETLGYVGNVRPFRQLADRLPAAEARALAAEGGPLAVQAILFGEGGLLPAQRGRYPLDGHTEAVEGAWRATGRRGPVQALGWSWRGCRPGNTPVRRLAAAAAGVAEGRWPPGEATVVILHELPPERAGGALRQLLCCAGDPYWRVHADFGRPLRRPAALVGPERAADAVVNALLPWSAAVGRHRGNPHLEEAAEAVYRLHPPLAQNQITRHMARQILGRAGPAAIRTACEQQGLLAIYRGWCDARDCGACPAGGGPPPSERLTGSRGWSPSAEVGVTAGRGLPPVVECANLGGCEETQSS